MSQSEWEGRSSNFLTKLAKTPMAALIWDRFPVNNAGEIEVLQDEIGRALFAGDEICYEDETLITKITRECMDNSEHEDIVDIAILYVCVRTQINNSEHIVPIFRLRNCSKEPEYCNIIDHSGQLYENFEHYLNHNKWGPCWLMIPSQAQYKLNKNDRCSVLIHDQASTSNVEESAYSREETVQLSEGKIFSSIKLLQEAQRKELANHKKKLSPEHHAIYDALRQAYHEIIQPGEIRKLHGDRNLIKDMGLVNNLNEYHKNFIIKEDGNLHINKVLTIHPRAFVQLPEKAKETLFEATKLFQNKEVSFEEFIKQVKAICRAYRFDSDEQISNYKDYLTKTFEVTSLEDVVMGNGHIFANLKPNEIARLYQVIFESLNGDKRYVKLAKGFCTKMGARNSTEFCAASEYIVRKVQKEYKVRTKKNRNPEGRGEKKLVEFYKDEIMEEFCANDFKDVGRSFQELITTCGKANEDVNPKFKNVWAAANHYDKHRALDKVGPDNVLSPETYFKIAQDLTSAPYSEVQWTQDGSSLCCTYISELCGAIAIKFVSLSDKKGIIATLYNNDKNKAIVPSKYTYHPDF